MTATACSLSLKGRFFYLQRLAFGGRVKGQSYGTGTTSKSGINLLRLEEDLSAAHLRLNNVNVVREHWQQCMKRYDRPHTMFYLDPPYWGTEGYGVEFGLDNYSEIAGLMRSVAGKVIVSVNDIPEMRQAFKGLPMRRVTIGYTVGKTPASRKAVGELIITNFR